MTLHKLTIELADHELERLKKVKESWDMQEQEDGNWDTDLEEYNDGFSLEYVAATIVATYKGA